MGMSEAAAELLIDLPRQFWRRAECCIGWPRQQVTQILLAFIGSGPKAEF
jgi:hypothetical protein